MSAKNHNRDASQFQLFVTTHFEEEHFVKGFLTDGDSLSGIRSMYMHIHL